MMAFQLPGPGPMVVASVHHTGVRKGPWIRVGWLGFSATGLSKSKGDKKKLGQRSSGEKQVVAWVEGATFLVW